MPIRGQLQLIILLTVVVALLLACTGFVAYELVARHPVMTEKLVVIIGLALTGALLAAWVLSLRFERVVSEPILSLVQTARTVSETGDYSLRATRSSGDEMGLLADWLNQMLATMQKNATELQGERNLLQQMMNQLPDRIFFKDLQSRFLRVNPALVKHFGRPITEIEGRTDFDFFGMEHAQPAFDDEQEVIRTGRVMVGKEEREVFPDGRVEWASTVKAPLCDSAGRIIGTFGVSRDVTARRQADEQVRQLAIRLEASNRELVDFAYVASHDLQEPLRKIQAFGDRLKTKCAGALDEDGRDYLGRMQNAASRMQVLINDLLSFSRVTTKAQPFVPVNLADIAREVLNDLEVRIEQTHGVVELGALPTLDADPLQMRQLLQNLIGNALKFCREDAAPVIHVGGVINGDGCCRLTVKDNGIGFDMKYVDRIFGVFQRLHGRDKYEGTGVGLAICRKIVERHGGDIAAESQPGEGAMFVIRLPVHHEKGSPQS